MDGYSHFGQVLPNRVFDNLENGGFVLWRFQVGQLFPSMGIKVVIRFFLDLLSLRHFVGLDLALFGLRFLRLDLLDNRGNLVHLLDLLYWLDLLHHLERWLLLQDLILVLLIFGALFLIDAAFKQMVRATLSAQNFMGIILEGPHCTLPLDIHALSSTLRLNCGNLRQWSINLVSRHHESLRFLQFGLFVIF